MELNEIIAQNLSELRKRKKLTQQELAEQIGYSDKSISKWERGYAIPSVDILIQFAQFYGVTLDELVQEHAVAVVTEHERAERGDNRKITIIALAGVVMWFIAAAVYANGRIQGQSDLIWLAFVFAVPASMLMVSIFTRHFYKKTIANVVFLSVFQWSLVFAFALTFYMIGESIWYILFVCVPIQAIILLIYQLRK